MSKVKDFNELMVHQIGDLTSAEQQLIEALPKMAEGATSPELKKAITTHLKQTKQQLTRLEKIAKELKMKDSDIATCKAMKGLVAEGSESLKNVVAGPVLDAAIIGAAQRVEHYEMAAYGTAATHAKLLGLTNIEALLRETLEEEGETDKLLTLLADKVVNKAALTTAK